MIKLLGKLHKRFFGNPTTMNPFVRKFGHSIFITHSLCTKTIENWVQEIEKDSGQLLDWSWFGGRAVIYFVGNKEKVICSILKFRSMHDKEFKLKWGHTYSTTERCDKYIQGIWEYNGLGSILEVP